VRWTTADGRTRSTGRKGLWVPGGKTTVCARERCSRCSSSSPLVDALFLIVVATRLGWAGDHGRARRVDGRPRDAFSSAEGRATLARVQRKLARGEPPTDELLDGGLLIAAGAFLLTPGLVTDAVGFLLARPLSRVPIRMAQEVRRDPVPRQRDQRVHHRKRVYRRIPRERRRRRNGAGAGFTMGGGFGGGNFGNGDGFGSDDEVAGGNSPVTIPTATASTTRTTRTMSSTWTSRSKTRRRTGATEAPPSTRSRLTVSRFRRDPLPTRSVSEATENRLTAGESRKETLKILPAQTNKCAHLGQ